MLSFLVCYTVSSFIFAIIFSEVYLHYTEKQK